MMKTKKQGQRNENDQKQRENISAKSALWMAKSNRSKHRFCYYYFDSPKKNYCLSLYPVILAVWTAGDNNAINIYLLLIRRVVEKETLEQRKTYFLDCWRWNANAKLPPIVVMANPSDAIFDASIHSFLCDGWTIDPFRSYYFGKHSPSHTHVFIISNDFCLSSSNL